MDRGEVAHADLGRFPCGRSRSGSLSAYHVLVATQAVPQLPGRNGHLSGLPGLLRLHNSLGCAPLWSADHYTRGAIPSSAPGGGFAETSGSNRRDHSVTRAVPGSCGWLGERMPGHRPMGRASCRAASSGASSRWKPFRGPRLRAEVTASVSSLTQYLQCRAMMLSASSWRPERGAGSRPFSIARSARLASVSSPLVIRLPSSPLHPW
jgi:hypothetical protein